MEKNKHYKGKEHIVTRLQAQNLKLIYFLSLTLSQLFGFRCLLYWSYFCYHFFVNKQAQPAG